MRSALLAALLICALVAAGCGGDDGETTASSPQTASVLVQDAPFVAAFAKVSGLTLDPVANETWTVLNVTPDRVVAATEKYGVFSVNVMHDVEGAEKILLADAEGTPLRADADGVYFGRNDNGTYSAAKVLEPNVLVRWQGTEAKATDATFDALVADLERAVTQALR